MQSSTPVSTSRMTGMRASAMRRSVISFARLGHLLRESTRPRVVREWRLADPADEQFLHADLGQLGDAAIALSDALDEPSGLIAPTARRLTQCRQFALRFGQLFLGRRQPGPL